MIKSNFLLRHRRLILILGIALITAIVVIGTYVANSIFPDGDAVGNEIKISGQKFKVVGILTETESGEESSADDIVLMPYKALNVNTYTA